MKHNWQNMKVDLIGKLTMYLPQNLGLSLSTKIIMDNFVGKGDLIGYYTPNQKLAHFALYLKNFCHVLENKICIL